MASCGTGVLAQLVSKTQIDDVITANETPEVSFFKAASQPYSQFATDWQKLSFAKQTLGTDVTETSADVQRTGDMLCHLYLVIKAPAIFNVSSAACDISGSVTNNALTANGYAGSIAAVKKRAYVGSTRSDNGPGRLVLSGSTIAVSNKTYVTIAGNQTSKVYPGCRLELILYTPSGVAALTSTTATVLKKNGVGTVADTLTSNIVTGSAFSAGPPPVITDGAIGSVSYVKATEFAGQTAVATITFNGGTASAFAQLQFTVGAVAFDGTNTHVSWHEQGTVANSVYLFRVYAQDDLGTLRPDMNASVVSINAPGVSATNALAAGPHRGGATTGIVSREAVLDPMNFAAHYGLYAPVQLIKQISIVIGSNTISTLTATVIQAHLEMFTPSDRLMKRMVNASRDPEELNAWALQPNVWYVPVPFWFASSSGYQASLPLVALSFHSITINATFQPYTRAIVNGCGGDMTDRTITMGATFGGDVAVTLETHSGAKAIDAVTGMGDGTLAPSFASTRVVESAQFSVFMLAEYIYLSDAERELYSDMTDEVLITQWQYATEQILTSDEAREITLSFNHPIQCLLFAGRLQSNINDHRWGEYEGSTNPLSVSARNPVGQRSYWLKEAQLKFNNSARTCPHGPEFFHQLMPSLAGERVPDSHLYLYPFSLSSPTSTQADGSANFSRLDSATLTLTPFAHLFKNQKLWGGLDGATKAAGAGTMASGQQVYVEIAAANWNTFKFENGMGGPGFV